MSRNLILSCATHYTGQHLQPFVQTWREQAKDTRLVLFTDHMVPGAIALLEAQGAEVLPAELSLHALGKGIGRAVNHLFLGWLSQGFTSLARRLVPIRSQELVERVFQALLDVSASRYALYRRYLEARAQRFDQVCCCDCRDLVFQESPFPVQGLHVYAENQTIGTSHFAKRWLQLTYGLKMHQRLAEKPFLCSGVTCGDTPSMLDYFRKMEDACKRVLALNGEDQAVHNVLVHTGQVEATVHAFGEGQAINLNDNRIEDLNLREGYLSDKNGHRIPLVHQYDRVPGLLERLAVLKTRHSH